MAATVDFYKSKGGLPSDGPLSVSVEQIGAQIVLSFPGQGGNAGPVQIDGAFKPPRGAGLSLDAVDRRAPCSRRT